MKKHSRCKENTIILFKAALLTAAVFLAPCLVSKNYEDALSGNASIWIEYIENGYIDEIYFSSTEDANKYYLSLLPEKFMERFYESGGTIILDNDRLEKIEIESSGKANSHTSGMYTKSTKTITLADSLAARREITILHELGHYYDNILNKASESEEFKMVAGSEIERHAHSRKINEDKDYPMSNYKQTGTYKEYFATAFEEYIAVPEYLKKVAPETYAYFDNTFGNTYITKGE